MAWTLADLEESLLIGSTLVEGSTLTEGQARQVLAGKTIFGHPIAEVRELVNYRSDGSRHDYLRPAQVPAAVEAWIEAFHQEPRCGLSAAKAAARAARLYYDFQNIHPFEDGNGRVGRIFVAYWLHWRAGLEWRFVLKDKHEHLHALDAANGGDMAVLARFFRERISRPRRPGC